MASTDEIYVEGERLVTIERLAKELGYSEKYLRQYARLGKFPGARKIGRRWWLSPAQMLDRKFSISTPGSFSKQEPSETHDETDLLDELGI